MPYKDRQVQREYQRVWIAARRAAFFADKRCCACGDTHNLDLHHKNPAEKLSHRIWSWSADKRQQEIAKCEVLCEKCHQSAHYPVLTHGSGRYNKGCRCVVCRQGKRNYMRRYRAENAA